MEKRELNTEVLKLEANEHLTHMLQNQDHIFQGHARALVILAMCSFTCKILSDEIEDIFS